MTFYPLELQHLSVKDYSGITWKARVLLIINLMGIKLLTALSILLDAQIFMKIER